MVDDKYKEIYDEWLQQQTTDSMQCLPDDEVRAKVGEFLAASKVQPIEEYMLLRKYNQLHDTYEPEQVTNLFGQKEWIVPRNKGLYRELSVKNDIWMQKEPDDYLQLQPELILTNSNKKYHEIYNALRLFTSTGENNNNIGRNLYYIVRDAVTEKYLGVLNASSDYLDVRVRDQSIGWTREQRNGGRLTHTAVGSIIVPTQPLGYNYVGGKLLSLLLLSDTVQKDWLNLYGDVLAGLTTTSFFGSFSQYTGLKYWKTLGKSMGSSTARPEPELYFIVRQWLKVNHTYRYWEWYHAQDPETGQKTKRDHINRSLLFAYSKLGFKPVDYITGHQRGIHFCELYTNTKEFLRDEIKEDQLIPRFDSSTAALVQLWKDKYAKNRIKNIVDQNRMLTESLFYDDMLTMTFQETKQKYLNQVGR